MAAYTAGKLLDFAIDIARRMTEGVVSLGEETRNAMAWRRVHA